MVSLDRDGGYYFGEDREFLLSVPDEGFEPRGHGAFRPLPTVWVSVVELLVLVAFEILVWFNVQLKWNVLDTHMPYPLMVMIHVFVWVVVALIDRYIQFHHRNSRLHGYLAFYRATREMRKVPFLCLSAGNTALLVLSTYWAYYEDQISVLRVIYTIEFAVISPAIIIYIVKLRKFNRSKAPPDVHEQLRASFRSRGPGTEEPTEVGFGEENYLDEILEKQSDMIKYLQQHNKSLSKRVVALSAQLHQQQVDGIGEGVTLDAEATETQMAAHDHELRVAIEERDATIHRLRNKLRRFQQRGEPQDGALP